MALRLMQLAFRLLRWVPDVVRGEFVTIGVVLRESRPGGRVMVRFTSDWSRLRAMGSSLEIEVLRELAEELAQRLVLMEQDDDRRALLDVACSSFSTGLQITEERGCLAEGMETELDRLVRMYAEPRKPERVGQLVDVPGRAAIVRGVRREFERSGLGAMMRREIAAAEYTGPGDRLRIDFGYRVESAKEERAVRMIQAVSLRQDAKMAKALAFSAARLREGVRRREGAALRLTAVVEPREEVDSAEGWTFAVEALEALQIGVLTTHGLPELAALARHELLM